MPQYDSKLMRPIAFLACLVTFVPRETSCQFLASSSSASPVSLDSPFKLVKQFELSDYNKEFDVQEFSDEGKTNSCANYINDGSTVFSRDKNLVLKVASDCPDGTCLNSGRVISKDGFKFGIFTITATVPKCNYLFPAVWLYPSKSAYGGWPCSGEIDIMETTHDMQFGTFNIVDGYANSSQCYDAQEPHYTLESTINEWAASRMFVENVDCSATNPSWSKHTFALYWQADELVAFVDPTFSYDSQGQMTGIQPSAATSDGVPSYKAYKRSSTPTWNAKGVSDYMSKHYADEASSSAPFDQEFKLIFNIAIGGYSPDVCGWGQSSCTSTCGGAKGSEMVVEDIRVWESTR